MDNQNSRDFFISIPYYEAKINKRGKIKTVTKYDTQGAKVDSWHLIWDRKGKRSEYNVKFYQHGEITRLDSLFFSHKDHIPPNFICFLKC